MNSFEVTKYDLLPIICLPTLFAIGVQNLCCTLVVFISIISLLFYVRFTIKSRAFQTKFFLSWTICSIIGLLAIFAVTINSYLLLPCEHYILITITIVALYFFHLVSTSENTRLFKYLMLHLTFRYVILLNFFFLLQVKRKAKRKTSVVDDDELLGITCYTRHATCTKCRQPFISSGPSICNTCQPTIGRWKHHCLWLNCFITEKNHLYFLFGQTLATIAFIFTANIFLINVCQPMVIDQVFEVNVLLPIDCTNVYETYE